MATSQIEKKILLLACSQANKNIAHLSLSEAKAPQVSYCVCIASDAEVFFLLPSRLYMYFFCGNTFQQK